VVAEQNVGDGGDFLSTAADGVWKIGISAGGVVSTYPVMVGLIFGRAGYASVARFLGALVRISSLGYPIMGLSFDLTGSYDGAYTLFIVFNLVAASLVLFIKKPGGPLAKASS